MSDKKKETPKKKRGPGRPKKVIKMPPKFVFPPCEGCGRDDVSTAKRRYLGGKQLCTDCAIKEIIKVTTGASVIIGILMFFI